MKRGLPLLVQELIVQLPKHRFFDTQIICLHSLRLSDDILYVTYNTEFPLGGQDSRGFPTTPPLI
jgi:hypothetical protein